MVSPSSPLGELGVEVRNRNPEALPDLTIAEQLTAVGAQAQPGPAARRGSIVADPGLGLDAASPRRGLGCGPAPRS